MEGSELTAEYKGRDLFVFTPRCAHVFASNFMPFSRDSSAGFARRWLILDFSRVVPEAEQVKTLAEDILADEREAIAAWAVQGLPRLLKQGHYTIPDSCKKRLEELRRQNNSVAAFFEDCKRLDWNNDKRMMLRELYDMYRFHKKDVSSGMAVGYERFAHMVEDLGLNVKMEGDGLGNQEWVVEGVGARND